MSSLPNNRSSTLFILESAPRTRMKKATVATEQDPTTPSATTNPVIPNDSQPSSSSRSLFACSNIRKTTKQDW